MLSCNLIFLTIYTLVSRPLTGFIKDGVLTATLVIIINLISTTLVLNSLLSMLERMISVNMRYE